MPDERERIFQQAVESIDLAKVPTLAGWTRKLAELEEHRANFGAINEGGCLVVQAGRKTDYRMERAIDLMGCLPGLRRGVALIFARYCPPGMLEDYPGLLEEIHGAGLREGKSEWHGWTDQLNGASGHFVGRFWTTAARRGVVKGKLVANF